MKKILLLLLGVFFMISCEEHCVIERTGNRIPINFSTPILIPTKVTDYSFLIDEQMGIYMIKAGTTLSASNIVDDVNNYEYYVSSLSLSVANFQPFTSDTIFFPTQGNVDFISYLPYSNSITSDFLCPVSAATEDQSNRMNLDFVYSNNAKNISTYNVSLIYEHILSFVEFTIVTESGLPLTEMVGMTVSLNNFSNTADVNLVDGSLKNINAPTQNVGLVGKYYTQNAAFIAEGIIIPQTVSANANVTFSMTNGRVFTYDFPNDMVFESGMIYRFYVTLERGTSGSFSGSIKYWTTGTITNNNIIAM